MPEPVTETPPAPPATPAPTVRIDRVRKAYGPRVLWDGLSLDLAPASMTALTGPSGVGKSTLLNCVGLIDTVDAGAIVVEGTDVTRIGARRARLYRRDVVGYLFQSYGLIETASVADNLAVTRAPRREFDDVLTRVGMAGRSREPVHHLSGGEQQRVALARLLLKRPRVVLADEPTGALDQGNGAMVVGMLRELADAGCTVLVATHSRDVAAACDAVVDLARPVSHAD